MSHTIDPRQAFIASLAPILELDPDTQKHLYDLLAVRQYENNDVLFANGKPGDRICFIHTGLARSFYAGKHDKDINAWFAAENDFIPPPYDMPNQQPTLETVVFLEKSMVVWLTREGMRELSGLNPATIALEPLLQNQHLSQYVEWVRMFHQYKGEERYDWFMGRYPHSRNRLDLKQIASFLKLDAATVSRIRKKKAGEGKK